jgi:hypothetical protein
MPLRIMHIMERNISNLDSLPYVAQAQDFPSEGNL